MKLRVGYPDPRSELAMLAANVGADGATRPVAKAVINPEQLRQLQEHIATVTLTEAVQKYLVDLAIATRNRREVTLGLSPRGLLIWQRVAQARAHLQGRGFVTPDDIQQVATPVLDVRLTGDFDSGPGLVEEILLSVDVPVF
jgi:MoxR-like ATPase